jgi:hypothetical protein
VLPVSMSPSLPVYSLITLTESNYLPLFVGM